MRRFLFFSLFVLMAMIIGCSSSETDQGSASDSGQAAGQTATAQATASTFAVYDIDGKVRRFEEFKGQKALIINFWGTWCPPCRREIPDLKRIYDEYKGQGLEILGMAVNDNPSSVKKFAEKMGMDWVMMIANVEAVQSFRVGTGIPVSIFIDRTGKEVGRFTGARDYETFKKYVEQII